MFDCPARCLFRGHRGRVSAPQSAARLTPKLARQVCSASGPKLTCESRPRCSSTATAGHSSRRPCRDTEKIPRSPVAELQRWKPALLSHCRSWHILCSSLLPSPSCSVRKKAGLLFCRSWHALCPFVVPLAELQCPQEAGVADRSSWHRHYPFLVFQDSERLTDT